MSKTKTQEGFRYKGFQCTVYFTGEENRYSGFATHLTSGYEINAPSFKDKTRVAAFLTKHIDHLVTQ